MEQVCVQSTALGRGTSPPSRRSFIMELKNDLCHDEYKQKEKTEYVKTTQRKLTRCERKLCIPLSKTGLKVIRSG